MSIGVNVAKNIASGQPFAVRVTSDDLVTMMVSLEVDGVRRAFGLLVESVEQPPQLEHSLQVQGSLDCEVLKWKTASPGATVKVFATSDAGDSSDFGVVLG